ncbi:CocE/NonD family hydrolase [Flavobacterium sp. CS20]|uniref:CocE/NonD family hydrolase n=1 Tax=Flavobacterium sp. CS20 TaxID=2775246 RepID=UPI001B3A5592|nr:CocE/NonD family hydrolase [Flavobacterium sp. CS20]QTY27141.1 CocE/NonD family hydrolase [Flavobacterium sp. CS20]
MRYFKAFSFSILFLLNISILVAQDNYVEQNYTKTEVDIPMRDGINLHTTIYSPKDTSQDFPILMQRTPYSSRPYGKGEFKKRIGPNEHLMKEGYIVVYQDVRGRWMSEGVYDNMRAYIPNKKGKQIDEASDTYDTIEWLVNNVENNNGKVGVWGISYPGFYSTYSLLSNHPALTAVSPQAPIGDFYFDDFHHNGAYLLSYWLATTVFGYMKDEPTDKAWYADKFPNIGTQDQYQFFLENMPLSKLDKFYGEDNVFWQQLKEHPNYDEFWQSRGIIQHLDEIDIQPAVMTVGGLFDAEDLYGPLHTYSEIEKHNDFYNIFVFGPWSHGQWASTRKRQAVGNVYFGDDISNNYQKDIETPFFNYFLKDKGNVDELSEAQIFDTGKKEWNAYQVWPPQNTTEKTFFLGENQSLTSTANPKFKNTFVSDPKKPVPYSEDIKVVFTPRKYMTDDQRFAARRPDVLVYETAVLEEDMKFVGDIIANLNVSTTETATDWVVKVIDVFPADAKDTEEVQDHLKMSNYHMMVRSEVMRGRFRNSFEKPEPFQPNKKTQVNIELQDINHTFKKGHKLQIQIQSSWFPLIDMNPQTYVDNIFKAKTEDFQKQTHTVFGDSKLVFYEVK